jgi:hypothetical protein
VGVAEDLLRAADPPQVLTKRSKAGAKGEQRQKTPYMGVIPLFFGTCALPLLNLLTAGDSPRQDTIEPVQSRKNRAVYFS